MFDNGNTALSSGLSVSTSRPVLRKFLLQSAKEVDKTLCCAAVFAGTDGNTCVSGVYACYAKQNFYDNFPKKQRRASEKMLTVVLLWELFYSPLKLRIRVYIQWMVI